MFENMCKCLFCREIRPRINGCLKFLLYTILLLIFPVMAFFTLILSFSKYRINRYFSIFSVSMQKKYYFVLLLPLHILAVVFIILFSVLASVILVGVLAIPYYLFLIIIIPCLFYEWVIEVPKRLDADDSSSSESSSTDSDEETDDEKNEKSIN